MSGKALLLFMLLGAMYLGTEAVTYGEQNM